MGHVYDLLKFGLKQEGRDDIVALTDPTNLFLEDCQKFLQWSLPSDNHCSDNFELLDSQIQRLSFITILFFVLILLETTSYNFYLPTLSLQISIEHEI